LNAVAEDKTSQAERDRRKRRLPIATSVQLQALHDPKSAREAYAKSVALDPENAEGFTGTLVPTSGGNLDAAEKSYLALLQLAGKGADENRIFWARTSLADIAVARGI